VKHNSKKKPVKHEKRLVKHERRLGKGTGSCHSI
jgi:hypothetical protein